ncbi:MAG: Chromosome partitioning protein ParB [Frankiales bacterium]|nr:Chromosome partitioning protein ParB [Frankiales bacterium]
MSNVTTAARVTPIAPAEIDDHPNNPRFDIGDVSELAASVAEHGILQPLTVVQRIDPQPGQTPWWLLMGHRRRAAALVAELPMVPCIVRNDLDTIPKQIEAMLEENDHREDLTAIEEAAAYEQLLAFDYTPEQIARVTGRSQSTVVGRLQLLKLSERIRNKVHARELTLADALALVEFSDDAADLKRAELYVGSDQWKWVREDIRRRRAAKAKRPQVIAKLKDKGIKIVKPSVNWEYDTSAKVRPVSQLAKPDGTDYTKPATEHADCPGHVAVVSDMAVVTYGCNKPGTHPKRTRSTGHGQPDPAQEQLEQDLETASRLRVAFMTELAQNLSEAQQRQVLAAEVAERLDGVLRYVDDEDLAFMCALVGIDPPAGELDDEKYETWLDNVLREITGWTVSRLVAVLAAVRVADAESGRGLRYAEVWPWRRGDEKLRAYMEWLQDLGYELSDVERDQLAPPPADAAAS